MVRFVFLLIASQVFVSSALPLWSGAATFAGAEVKRTKTKRVMILPFNNLTSNAAADFLGFAIAYEVSGKLSQTRSITARMPEAELREATDDLLAGVARQSNAEYVLTGTYRKTGNRLLLTARLVKVRVKETLWNVPLEAPFSDLRIIPEILFRRIIMEWGITLSAEEERRLRKDKANDATAYELYLRAMALRPATASHWQRQRELLERSIELDDASPRSATHTCNTRARRAGARVTTSKLKQFCVMAAGIAAGIVFGERATIVQPVGDLFIRLLLTLTSAIPASTTWEQSSR